MPGPPICGICSVCVPTDGRFMKCAECQSFLHLGQCAGIADTTFTTMGASKREKWRCKSCRWKDSQPSTTNLETVSQENSHMFSAQLTAVNEKLDMLLSLQKSVDSLLTLPAKVDAILALQPTVDWLRTTVEEVEKSVTFLNGQYDTMLADVTTNKKIARELGAEVIALQDTVKEQASAIHMLQAELNQSDQQHRLSNMEIQGLPSTPNENLSLVLCDLASKIGLSNFQPSDVHSVQRLTSKKTDKRDTAPVILVRFASVMIKEQWMGRRGQLRELNLAGCLPKLFFNDNLTRANRELFWMARSKGRERHIKYVWVKHAQIYAKKSESSTVLRMNFVGDIEKMI
ncbi:unnamed protein product [Ixodes hexagonus]